MVGSRAMFDIREREWGGGGGDGESNLFSFITISDIARLSNLGTPDNIDKQECTIFI